MRSDQGQSMSNSKSVCLFLMFLSTTQHPYSEVKALMVEVQDVAVILLHCLA